MKHAVVSEEDELTRGHRLTPLFEASLQFRSESPAEVVVSSERRTGELLGSGDGLFSGLLGGTVRWSCWSGDCLYPLIRKGQEVPDDLHLCTIDVGGIIETPDGARVRFEARGYGLRRPEEYLVSSTLTFGTDDPRYTWLTTALGVMEGTFDEKLGRATWRAFLPEDRLP